MTTQLFLRAGTRRLAITVISIFAAASGLGIAAQKASAPPKLTIDDLIAKHALSIGTAEARAATHSRVLVGVGTLTSKINYAGKMGGMTQLAALDDDFLLAMKFNSNDYPFDKFAFDGHDMSYGHFATGGSILTGFVKLYPAVVKKGIFGGIYRPTWVSDSKDKAIKLEYNGTTSNSDGTFYKARVSGTGLTEVTITLFFDAGTFRHVKTEYYFEAGSELLGYNPDRGIGGGGVQHSTIVENFANFAKAGDLILPLSYSIHYQGTDTSVDWKINFSDVYYDQKLDSSAFKVS